MMVEAAGHYLFFKSRIGPLPINEHQVSFFHTIGGLLPSFQLGMLLLGGNLNVPLNPLVDSLTGASALSYELH